MKLKEISGYLNVKKFFGADGVEINGLCADSRNVKKGDLFFCYKGREHDSHTCIAEAAEGGAVAVVCERQIENCDLPQIIVDDGRTAIVDAARAFYGFADKKLRIIAVTGTNGKTTTVSMLNEMINACGNRSVACGNNGNPLIKEVEDLAFKDFAVIEISSFQLETLTSLRPHIAVVTNVTEDHLNRHYNMENYIFLKSKILRNLRESEFAVLNYDDPVVRSFAKNTKAKTVYFSVQSRVEGAYFQDGGLYYNGEKYFDINDMNVSGVHNVYNALACVAVAGILGLDKTLASNALCAFKGVSHRIEKIREVNGVTYIDDSKGTNIDATLKAAQTMREPTVLLLGGKDKGDDYAPLFEGLSSGPVVHAIIYGENRFKMLNAAIRAGFVSFSLCSEFETAVKLAQFIAKPGQSVLLSPASASFDGFANYEERGKAFKAIVDGINEETSK